MVVSMLLMVSVNLEMSLMVLMAIILHLLLMAAPQLLNLAVDLVDHQPPKLVAVSRLFLVAVSRLLLVAMSSLALQSEEEEAAEDQVEAQLRLLAASSLRI
jgi:hypothetical protein